jgi:hypothetical protein
VAGGPNIFLSEIVTPFVHKFRNLSYCKKKLKRGGHRLKPTTNFTRIFSGVTSSAKNLLRKPVARGGTVTVMKLVRCAILYAICSMGEILKMGMDLNFVLVLFFVHDTSFALLDCF